MRPYILFTVILWSSALCAQVYTVNSSDDVDDGICDGVHCSLREAIIAAEADGIPSTIFFNIPGAGPHIIHPNDTFPSITQSDLIIVGQSQPGKLGDIIIDFNYRYFSGKSFWHIDNQKFEISGLTFMKYLYFNNDDHIFEIGKHHKSTRDIKIYQCAFHTDTNNLRVENRGVAIHVFSCDNFIFRKNMFGTDFLKSSVINTFGHLKLAYEMKNKTAIIDSNIFVNVNRFAAPIRVWGGNLIIKNNLIGALDSNNVLNILSSTECIELHSESKGSIHDNFLCGARTGIQISTNQNINVTSNKFYNIRNYCIVLGQYSKNVSLVNIKNNIVENSKIFLFVRSEDSLKLIIENNHAENIESFCDVALYPSNIYLKHINNKIFCSKRGPIWYDDLQGHPWIPQTRTPKIIFVNTNEVKGTSNSFDSISVYANPKTNCPLFAGHCSGGYEIGRTQADGFGNWKLTNISFPEKATISAYAYNPDPNAAHSYYSEFSECNQCHDTIKVKFEQQLCNGHTINYRGKLYSVSNSKDTIFVNGDGFDICDSILVVNIEFRPIQRSNINLPLCYNDTLRFGSALIHNGHLIDSLVLQDASGCDSIITITGNLMGLGFFTKAICDDEYVDIRGSIFNRDNPSGVVVFPKGSSNGCDSVLHVALTINPSFLLEFTASDLKCGSPNTGGLLVKEIRGGSGNLKYSLDGAPMITYHQDTIIGNLSQGNHTIRISDALSCDTVYNFTINNSQLLDLQLPGDTTIKKGNSVNISAFINFNSNEIIWDPANFLSCDTCLNTTATPDNTITYTLTVSDENDCTISESMTITVLIDVADIYLPNAFSPNGDNINDLFKPEFKIPENTRIILFQIFDRWGNMIYERTNGIKGETFGWDGSVDQEKMNPGVYGYIIQFVGEDGVAKWKTGDVTLMR